MRVRVICRIDRWWESCFVLILQAAHNFKVKYLSVISHVLTRVLQRYRCICNLERLRGKRVCEPTYFYSRFFVESEWCTCSCSQWRGALTGIINAIQSAGLCSAGSSCLRARCGGVTWAWEAWWEHTVWISHTDESWHGGEKELPGLTFDFRGSSRALLSDPLKG